MYTFQKHVYYIITNTYVASKMAYLRSCKITFVLVVRMKEVDTDTFR